MCRVRLAKRIATMGKSIIALALICFVGFGAAPAVADCVNDMESALKFLESMPEGRMKERTQRELRMAQEAIANGDESQCLIHVGVCAQYTQR